MLYLKLEKIFKALLNNLQSNLYQLNQTKNPFNNKQNKQLQHQQQKNYIYIYIYTYTYIHIHKHIYIHTLYIHIYISAIKDASPKA